MIRPALAAALLAFTAGARAERPDHPVGPAHLPDDYQDPLHEPPPRPQSAPEKEFASLPPPAVFPEPELQRPPIALDGLDLPLAGIYAPAEPAVVTQKPEEAPDEPQIAEEIAEESAEMEELREAEEKARLDQPVRPEDEAARAAARLSPLSPLGDRLHDALGRDPVIYFPGSRPHGSISELPEMDHDLASLQAEYDIPIEVNDAVIDYIRFFQHEPARKHFVKWLGRSHRYIPRYREIMREHGLPEDTVFLAMIESGFANYAFSRKKASGPWQFIGPTGKRMGLAQDFWVDERRDPEKAAHSAAKYLKELYSQTGDWRLAWAGYNAGVGKVYRAQRAGQQDFWSMTRGRILRKETKGYVPKLMAAAIITKHTRLFGFRDEEITPEAWPEYETVDIPEATELAAVAKAALVPDQVLVDLNPELRRSCTPPHPYKLKVPKGRAEAFAKNWPSVKDDEKLAFAHHRVQRGDTMTAIAAAYSVSAATITKMNGLKSGRRLAPGSELVIPLSAMARKKGQAPANEQAARARIEEFQKKNPSAIARDPEPRKVASAARVETVAGRTKVTIQVQEGDSLWAISQKHGVTVDELCRWNGIKNPRRVKLQIGQELVVYPKPSDAAPSSAPKPG